MAKTREIACKYYECEGQCNKRREGTFRHKCQTCNLYSAIKGGQPARKDLRRQKKERNDRKEVKNLLGTYS